MTSKHTPGPWRAAEDPLSDQGYVTDIVAGNTRVASTDHNWNDAGFNERRISWAEAQANARLIAEAPAMLEALRKVRDTIPDHDYDNCRVNGVLSCNCEYGPLHDQIRAILARIEGAQ